MTQKKENKGNFKNAGAKYRKVKDPHKVLDHDFLISEFVVTSISCWRNAIGKNIFPAAKRIYITCDGGGSNGSRSRNWKYELQQLANDTGLEIMVSHYPPGTELELLYIDDLVNEMLDALEGREHHCEFDLGAKNRNR